MNRRGALNRGSALEQRRTLPVSLPARSDVIERGAQTAEQFAGLKAKARAIGDALIHFGIDTPLDLIGEIENPTVTTNIVFLTVPNGQIARIERIALYYSDPAIAMMDVIGWRLTVNGNRVPNIKQIQSEFFFQSIGDMFTPMDIEPLIVQANNLVALEITVLGGFAGALTLTGRISGRLYKQASLELAVM